MSFCVGALKTLIQNNFLKKQSEVVHKPFTLRAILMSHYNITVTRSRFFLLNFMLANHKPFVGKGGGGWVGGLKGQRGTERRCKTHNVVMINSTTL